ncbi:NAD-dependent epimerase/dehydratase family protein [Raineyella fluvialis]|uniref:NAD-dependent epimerase/dehydratase family protein n=1 Tax=Raineyella fluvialis TaxID=2662261 RepID=A0A5Q2FBN1_9ACTN|nr:NAD-dependent epimerase/dehydratase family protein [Raineyella fluvialis]QGF23811.1 NAD-dependent epimerase/dehydratase family protein [Raineyella fluvialis]
MQFVLGAGSVGTHLARLLTDSGEDVVLASRSGTGPEIPGTRRLVVDAADADALSRAVAGASVLYNVLNPPRYNTWPQVWPPVSAALITAAERSGAVLAAASNLYMYGIPTGPMTEQTPVAPAEGKGQVRAAMTRDALAAHEAGRIRYVEVRSADYVGAGVTYTSHITRQLPPAFKGRGVSVVGEPDQPHTWTDVLDVARSLVTVASSEQALGRVWHATSNPPRTQREAITDILASVGKPAVPVRPLPRWLYPTLGLVMPQVREVARMTFQFDRPFVMDSSAIQQELGLEPTPWDEVCRRTAESLA